MERLFSVIIVLLTVIFILSGCAVKTYQVTKDRVDQDTYAGNRGYLKGEAEAQSPDRKTTRTIRVVEIDLGGPKQKPTQTKISETTKQEEVIEPAYEEETLESTGTTATQTTEKYLVQKNDTLQKISQKFYGTTKNWYKIYQANQDTLKAPDKLYPGQTINIPIAGLKETKENLK
jgi:nucleoid-associated protein YgaU